MLISPNGSSEALVWQWSGVFHTSSPSSSSIHILKEYISNVGCQLRSNSLCKTSSDKGKGCISFMYDCIVPMVVMATQSCYRFIMEKQTLKYML